jgi:hypothetical protein
MNDQQKKEQYSGVRDQEIRAALDRHWAASDANEFETEHRIYHEDAVLEYPQSGERTRGRRNIQNQRASHPSRKRFAVRRIIGSGDLWVTEFILTYDGKPSWTVSIILSLQFDKKLNALAESECATHQVALFLRSPQSLHRVEVSAP